MASQVEPYVTALFAGLGSGAVYAMVATGYNLVFRATGVFNLAQGHLLSFGALITFTLWVSHGVPILVTAVIATVAVAAIGMLQERLTVAPLRRRGDLNSMAWVITTLGAAVVLENIAQLVWGSDVHPVPPLIPGGPLHIGGAPVQVANIVVVVAAVAVTLGLTWWTDRTRRGKDWSATAEDMVAARVRGINTGRIGWASFATASAISGAAGFLVAPITSAAFNTGDLLTLKGFVAIAIGGFGSAHGALVGGLVLGVVEAQAVLLASSAWRDIVTLAVLLIVLVLRPNGLFGRYRERVV